MGPGLSFVPGRRLSLALRTEVGAASRYFRALDFAPADVARQSRPPEDLDLQMMPAFAAARVQVVAETGAAVAEGKFKRLADGLVQSLDAALREGVRRSLRVYPGEEQRFVRVDVADAGDRLLVE